MKQLDYIGRLQDLKFLRDVYGRLITDEYSTFYKCENIQQLITKTNYEIRRIEEILHQSECIDSYDQNTGVVLGEEIN